MPVPAIMQRQQWGKDRRLLLIDFAVAYFDESAPLYGGRTVRPRLDHAATAAPAARAAGVPVIFTEVKYLPGGADGGAFYAKVPALSCFDAGNGDAETGTGTGR